MSNPRHRLRLWLLLLLPLTLLAGCAPHRGWESALVLADIAAGSGPSRLKRTTPAPSREEVAFAVADRSYSGDLYRPGGEVRSGLLLIPGAAEAGKDDPRLVAFATTLARARFAVLVPDLASLRALQVNPGNIREVADAFAWLAGRPELAPGGRAGMAAFSYAAGPAILAALEPAIAERVEFILAVGGYYDLERVLTFFTTGWFRVDGRWRRLEPNEYGKWVFVLSNLDRLADPGDHQRFRAMAERKKADLGADLSDLAQGLTSEGDQLYVFLANRDRRRAPGLQQGLPEGVRADLAALTLAGKDLSRLHARLLLVHGRDDAIIPFAESLALAAALPEGQARVYLTGGLAHVDLKPGLLDRFRLWRALCALLAARDGKW
jgi:pimeloyl-ACP methyl ester carboxylesterase